MNKFILNIFLSLSMVYIYSNSVFTQNLVPNPSFEDIIQCPDNQAQTYYASPWFQPMENPSVQGDFVTMCSSDLFHLCATPPIEIMPGIYSTYSAEIPCNWVGCQYPRTGKSYAGIGFWHNNENREMIETPLSESLIKDSSYCVSMYVVNKRAEGFHGTSTSNLHFLFTVDSLKLEQYYWTTTPSAKNPDDNIISDTTNWTLVSGIYKAKGGESFLTIGSFYDNANSTVIDEEQFLAYYFIDDVCVSMLKDNSEGAEEEEEDEDEEEITEELKVPNIFTPNGDGINDFWFVPFKNSTDYVIILNRWGNEITILNQDNPKWDGNCKGKPCNDGIYFYKAYLNGKYKDGFIQLVR